MSNRFGSKLIYLGLAGIAMAQTKPARTTWHVGDGSFTYTSFHVALKGEHLDFTILGKPSHGVLPTQSAEFNSAKVVGQAAKIQGKFEIRTLDMPLGGDLSGKKNGSLTKVTAGELNAKMAGSQGTANLSGNVKISNVRTTPKESSLLTGRKGRIEFNAGSENWLNHAELTGTVTFSNSGIDSKGEKHTLFGSGDQMTLDPEGENYRVHIKGNVHISGENQPLLSGGPDSGTTDADSAKLLIDATGAILEADLEGDPGETTFKEHPTK